MATMALSCNADYIERIADGHLWITELSVMKDGKRIDSGANRYWKGVVETGGVDKHLMAARIRERKSIYPSDASVYIRGFISVKPCQTTS